MDHSAGRSRVGLLALPCKATLLMNSSNLLVLHRSQPLAMRERGTGAAFLGVLLAPLAGLAAGLCYYRANLHLLLQKYEAVIINEAEFSTDRSTDSVAVDEFEESEEGLKV